MRNFIISICTLSLAGCGTVDAVKKWSYEMGEKMPVYDEENRCTERAFCFSEDGKSNNGSASGTPDIRGYVPPPSPPPGYTNTQAPPFAQPSTQQQDPRYMHPSHPNSLYYDPMAPEPYPTGGNTSQATPSSNDGRGQIKPPNHNQHPQYAIPPTAPRHMQAPAASIPLPSSIAPTHTPGDIPPPPPGYTPGQFNEEEQMKPWEENPEWKDDLPPLPQHLEELKRRME